MTDGRHLRVDCVQGRRESRATGEHGRCTDLHGHHTAVQRPLCSRVHTGRHGPVHGMHRLSGQPADDQRTRRRRRAVSARE